VKKYKIPIAIVALMLVLLYLVNWAFFDIQRIKGEEVLTKSISPDSQYTVTAYLNNGGATTDYAVLCSVVNHETGKSRNIYWNYHCEEADITWKDKDTVVINGVELDVDKDSYDYRND